MKDDKENDIEMNDGDSTESPADGNNMHANPESEKKPHSPKPTPGVPTTPQFSSSQSKNSQLFMLPGQRSQM